MSYLVNVLLSARHASANNAATYQQDAATKWELTVRERYSDSNRVGAFKSRHLNVDVHGTAVTPSTPFQKKLPDLCDWWYEEVVGLKKHPFDCSQEILKLALQDKKDESCTIDFLSYEKRLTMQIKDPDVIRSLMRHVQLLAYTYSNNENAELLVKKNVKRTPDKEEDKEREYVDVRTGDTLEEREPPLCPTPKKQEIFFLDTRKTTKGTVELEYKKFAQAKGTSSKLLFIKSVQRQLD